MYVGVIRPGSLYLNRSSRLRRERGSEKGFRGRDGIAGRSPAGLGQRFGFEEQVRWWRPRTESGEAGKGNWSRHHVQGGCGVLPASLG